MQSLSLQDSDPADLSPSGKIWPQREEFPLGYGIMTNSAFPRTMKASFVPEQLSLILRIHPEDEAHA